MATYEYSTTKLIKLNATQELMKRTFDILLSIFALSLFWWLIFLAWIASCIDTRSNGFFLQQRIGRRGKHFTIIKIKTMKSIASINTTVTQKGDPRITKLGSFLRKAKIDELPQLFNVLLGHMSFVGPRPDVPGFADKLQGAEQAVLLLRPGITGPATLKYRDEEDILALQEYPESYNRNVIWPDKVRLNLEYIRDWSLRKDIYYILRTVLD